MKTKYFLYILYEILNYSQRIKIATLILDDASDSIKLELLSGEKYRLILETITEPI